jgi:hypothetical protein
MNICKIFKKTMTERFNKSLMFCHYGYSLTICACNKLPKMINKMSDTCGNLYYSHIIHYNIGIYPPPPPILFTISAHYTARQESV